MQFFLSRLGPNILLPSRLGRNTNSTTKLYSMEHGVMTGFVQPTGCPYPNGRPRKMSPDTYAILSTIWVAVGILERSMLGTILGVIMAFFWGIMWIIFK